MNNVAVDCRFVDSLTIVIVCYNSGGVIIDGLSGLIESNLFSVVVIDNKSTDNSVACLRDAFPSIKIICLELNGGYGRAANLGVRHSHTPYVLLLNPDIAVTASAVADFFSASKNLSFEWALMAPATKKENYLKSGVIKTNFILGSAMLFDKQKFSSVGLFDESFFLFYEETDLCRRVLLANQSIYLNTDCYFKHAGGMSSGSSEKIEFAKQWHKGWSSSYYFSKYKLARGKRHPVALLIRYAWKSCFSWDVHKRQKHRARLAGLLAYLRGQEAFNERGFPRGFK